MQTKRCPRCELTKPVDDFYRERGRRDGLSAWCKPCGQGAKVASRRKALAENPEQVAARAKEYKRRYAEKHPDRVARSARRQQLKRRFGITPEDYDRMLGEQNGVCAICRQACSRELAVDHDHATGRVRGLLCSNCNTAIGLFGDNAERLRSAIQYLEEK